MNREKLLLKGKLAELKTKLKENEIVADGLIAEIRMELNPLIIDNFIDIDMEKAKKLFEELFEKWRDAKELYIQIRRIEEQL